MSNFMRRTKHPVTGEFEEAAWLDDYFGPHEYGVKFPSTPRVFRESGRDWEFEDRATTDHSPSERKWRSKKTGTIYASVEHNGSPVATVTTEAGSSYSVRWDNLEEVNSSPSGTGSKDYKPLNDCGLVTPMCRTAGKCLGHLPREAATHDSSDRELTKILTDYIQHDVTLRETISRIKADREAAVLSEARGYCDDGHYHDYKRDMAMLPSERIAELEAKQSNLKGESDAKR